MGRQDFVYGPGFFFFTRPPGNQTPREQRVNQVYSKIYVSYPPMSHSSATPIPSHRLALCPPSEQTSAPVGEFEPDHRAKTRPCCINTSCFIFRIIAVGFIDAAGSFWVSLDEGA